MEEQKACVGIDLGTTYSSIAWVDDSGHVEVLPNSDGQLATPSVVFMDGDTVLVGSEAARAALLEPEKSAECFKRDMGRAAYGRKVCGKTMRPEVLSAMVLRKLKQDAEQKIGPISSAIITIPAYFDETRRKATQDAGRLAGLEVNTLLNEPIAASIQYGYSVLGHSQTPREHTVLVYDLGGGTFDATLMRVTPDGEFLTIATDGDVMLGGKDWDLRLLDYVASEFMNKVGLDPREDALSFQELSLKVEEAKRTLSKRPSVTIAITHAGQRLGIHVDQTHFADLTADLVNRTQTTVELLVAEAKLSWSQVDRVLLVGGSSRMPMVQAMLRRTTGKEPDACLDPDLAVARGAAIFARSQDVKRGVQLRAADETVANRFKQLRHRNVNSHSLGVEAYNEKNGQVENSIIIPKNTPLPAENTQTYLTVEPTSATSSYIQIQVLEGESHDPQACIPVGTCSIENLPAGLPANSPIQITFSYSEDGRLHVRALVKSVDRSASAEIIRPQALNAKDLETQQQLLVGLKIV
jgi:molecular chaperone DnaK